MRLLLFTILFFVSVFPASAQTSLYQRYWVQFTDKNNNPNSLNNPAAFLSEKAMVRRQKQNISLDETDLPVTPSYIDSITKTGVTILLRSKWLNSVTIFTEDSLALQKIDSFPFVKNIRPVGRKVKQRANSIFINAGQYDEVSEDIFNYGFASNEIELLNGKVLHEKGFRGEGIEIAMLDVGFQNADKLTVFDSLNSDKRVLGTYDFVERNDSVYDDTEHGSMCLSTIAADLPGVFIGTAPKASFWLFHTEEENSEFPVEELNWTSAAEFADSIGADIISSSLGYTTFDSLLVDTLNNIKIPNPGNHSYSDMNGKTAFASVAAGMASKKGMIVCSSAGNSAFRSSNESWYFISSPADAEGILAVGAVDPSGTITNFSSRGPSSDGRIKPDVVAQGLGVTIVSPTYNTVDNFGSGTSFACPITAGLVACLWQAHPEKTNMEIINAVKRSASYFHNPNNDYGYGIPNFALADLLLTGVDLDSFTAVSELIIFPNPFRNNPTIVYFNAEKNTTIHLEFYDMQGRLVKSELASVNYGVTQLLPDFSNLFAGSYFIRIFSDKSSNLVRAIKQ